MVIIEGYCVIGSKITWKEATRRPNVVGTTLLQCCVTIISDYDVGSTLVRQHFVCWVNYICIDMLTLDLISTNPC